ncbi:MAG: TIR domain-containing protein [Sphingomicrobium sp.]
MPHVFISYSRSTEVQAQQVAEALRSLGHDVWRDDQLPAHRAYSEVIEERVQAAGAVVVIWSAEATRSQWVRAEADAAREKGTLIQVSIDGTIPPMPFNQIHCADLQGWDGDDSAPGWRKVTGSVTALLGTSSGPVPRSPKRDKVSICVLPFANMSGDAEQEYFSDGISEDITTDLSKISALAVVARNTAFTFKSDAVDIAHVAQKLGVSHVLEGSVRKAGDRVRITAQLIDGATGDHVWAERYDRDLTDIFAIQDEISQAIVAALKLKLLPDEKEAIEQRGTISAEAYNLYLMARQYWITGNHGDPRREERVVRICKRAVEVDPNYAKAWGLMALAEANLHFSYGGDGDGGLDSAERALALDTAIAEAHCVKARHFSDEEKNEEANAEIAIALKLDPESWEVNREAARLCMLERRVSEATRYFEKATELMESDFHAWGLLITCYRARQDEERVKFASKMMMEQAQKALAQDPSNGAALGLVASGLALLGERERAREWIDRSLLIDPDNLNTRYNFACVLANELHELEAALDLLVPVLAKAGRHTVRMADMDPDFDTLRGDPRFDKALADAKARLGIKSLAPSTPPASAAPLRS